MTHWYDVVFWVFFGAGLLFIAGIIIRLIVEAVRDRRKPFVRKYGPNTRYTSVYDTTWGIGGTDSSTGFDTSSPSSDSGGSDSSSDSGSSDSGGGFESGGGESGGGGSSGGWND